MNVQNYTTLGLELKELGTINAFGAFQQDNVLIHSTAHYTE